MRSMSFLRVPLSALVAALMLAGCYSFAEPSFEPGTARDVLKLMDRYGVVLTEPLAGSTACDDPELIGNSLHVTGRMEGETEYRDIYIHSYREKRWEESVTEVDRCMAEYAQAHPGAEITRLDIPTYRVFGPDWSDEMTEALTKAFEDAQHAGKIA